MISQVSACRRFPERRSGTFNWRDCHGLVLVRLPSGPTVRIALGVVLLVNPLYVGAFHLDEPNWYRYEATEVTYDDRLEFDVHADGVDDEIACVRDVHPGRACALEHAVYGHGGNLTAPIPWGDFIATYQPFGYRYAYLHGEFYAVEATERGDETVLSLNRTPADEAMADVATRIDRVAPPIRTAVRTGTVETHREIDGTTQLVRDGDSYYVVYRAAAQIEGPDTSESGRFLELVVSLLGIVLGLALVLRGQRRRVENERTS